MDLFDAPGPPSTIHISEINLPPVIKKWMTPWGNSEFVRLVRSHGHTTYTIDPVGISSISAACSDALYDSYSVDAIEHTIASVAKSVAEEHLDALELRRERNEFRAGLKMPPRPLPVQRETERNPGMAENTNTNTIPARGGQNFWCPDCGNGDTCDTCNACDACDCMQCAESDSGYDSNDEWSHDA